MDAAAYPRTYDVSFGWKVFLLPCGVLFGLAGIAGLAFLVLQGGNTPIWATLFLSAIAIAFAAMGFGAALSALMYRVTLRSDGLEVVEPFRRRQLLFQEIQGRRTLRNQQGPATLVLVPKDRTARRLKISLVLKKDRAFDAWIARLPDLDQQELDRSAQEVEQALYQDRMPHERGAHVARLKLQAKVLNGATIALCIAAYFMPDYYNLLTGALVALPWIGVWLVARYQPLYRFGARRNDAHPDLTAVLMVPGLMLAARALSDVHTFDWSGPLMLALSGGLALSVAALRVDPWFRQQRVAVVLMCFFTLAYGLGAGLEINVLGDSSRPDVYPTQVLGKRVSRGSKSSTYYLRVGPWGPLTAGGEISVPASRYRTTLAGDTVCVFVGKGALQVRWYQVRDCPNNDMSGFR
jgi:hypothetical protein